MLIPRLPGASINVKRVERITNKLSGTVSIVVGKLATLEIKVIPLVLIGTNKCGK